MKTILLLSLLLALVSCGKTKTEERDDAVDVALSYLSDSKCGAAIDLLEKVGRDLEDPLYVQVLASAYACRAGYNEISFLTTDLPSLVATSAQFFRTLSQFSASNEHQADSRFYQDLRTGLNILLNNGSVQPSQAARTSKFGVRKSGDIGVQILFLNLVQLGKFLNFYGNTNNNGLKGFGTVNVDEQSSTPSVCFIKYTNPTVTSSLGNTNPGPGGVCVANGEGHPNLGLTASELSTTKRRMCEGLMLVTNLLDILNNIELPESEAFDKISGVKGSISPLTDAATALGPDVAKFLDITSQSKCEEVIADASEFDNFQILYATVFEAGLK